MYYEEVKRLIKDPLLQNELGILADERELGFEDDNQENDGHLPNIGQENVERSHLLAKYRQTDAYKRLLKRQGQAVRRIERIKENFEKKRMQVSMLAVSQAKMKPAEQIYSSNHNSYINSEFQLTKGSLSSHFVNQGISNNSSLKTKLNGQLKLTELNEEQEEFEMTFATNQLSKSNEGDTEEIVRLNRGRERPHTHGIIGGGAATTTGVKSFMSNQTPLSHQVITEEKSSLGSHFATREEKNAQAHSHSIRTGAGGYQHADASSHIRKLQGLNKIVPYMKTQQGYFKNQQRERLQLQEVSGIKSSRSKVSFAANMNLASEQSGRQKSSQPKTSDKSFNFSCFYNSQGNISTTDKGEQQRTHLKSPQSQNREQEDVLLHHMNLVTGIHTYSSEIMKNRLASKAAEQRAFYKPSFAPVQNAYQSRVSATQKNRQGQKYGGDFSNFSVFSLQPGDTSYSSQLKNSSLGQSRPQTTQYELAGALGLNDSSVFADAVKKQISESQARPKQELSNDNQFDAAKENQHAKVASVDEDDVVMIKQTQQQQQTQKPLFLPSKIKPLSQSQKARSKSNQRHQEKGSIIGQRDLSFMRSRDKSHNRTKVAGQIVREQEEEYQDSKIVSNQITITSEQSRNMQTHNKSSATTKTQPQTFLRDFTQTYEKQQHQLYLNRQNKSEDKFLKTKRQDILRGIANGHMTNVYGTYGGFDLKKQELEIKRLKLEKKRLQLTSGDLLSSHLDENSDHEKSKSVIDAHIDLQQNKGASRSYLNKKNEIIANIKSKEYWPETMKRPEQYREFFWAQDLSVCGFTSNQSYERSKLREQKEQQKRALIAEQILAMKRGGGKMQTSSKEKIAETATDNASNMESKVN